MIKTQELKLLGKIIIKGKIGAKTGLHIGGSSTGLEIGGTDNIVIRDIITRTPYIPGSSLKGKMRNLLEKEKGMAIDNERIWVVKPDYDKQGTVIKEGISIHMCDKEDCIICNIFGRNNGKQTKVKDDEEIFIRNTTPTRLIVRDSNLTEESTKELEEAETDLPYTEVKFENVIDRITSAANPRQIERVPAGAVFDFEIIYNIFNNMDVDYLKYVFEAMKLLEDDYLGGQGTRGYGKVELKEIDIEWRPKNYYESGQDTDKISNLNNKWSTINQISQNFENIRNQISI